MRRWGLAVAFSLTIALAGATRSVAQETTGSLAGTVVDTKGEPVASAAVTVRGPIGTRDASTNARGEFLVPFLTPGDYTVSVAREGFTPVADEAVSVRLGQRTTTRLVMLPAVHEEVEVSGARMTQEIDQTTQQTGSNIPNEIADALPMGRNVQNVVFLAPGVKDSLGPGGANPSISGGSGLENQYVFDGINVTNAGYGALGSYSLLHKSLGQGINFNFVEETQVITGGFAAEYGQALGGIVNIVAKSGTNEWHGELFGNFTPTSTQAGFTTPLLANTPSYETTGIERLDYGFDVGGPILKDRVFFWVGANPTKTEESRLAPVGYGLRDLGPLTRKDDTLNWAAKLTFQPKPGHRIDFTAFGDPTESNFTFTRAINGRASSALRQADFSQFSEIDYGYTNWGIRYQGAATERLLIEAQVANANNTFDEQFPAEFDKNRQTDLTAVPQVVSGGIGYFEKNESDNTQANFKLTRLWGRHEVKLGVGREDIDYITTTDRTGPGYVNRFGEQTTTGISVLKLTDDTLVGDPRVREFDANGVPIFYSVVRGLLSDPDRSTHSDYNFAFLQDTWSVTPDLKLNFGLRYERQSIEGEAVQYDFPGEWSPRVGISWDHTGEGHSKVYGHWGRFFEKIPLDMAVRVFSPESSISQDDYYDAGLTAPIGPTDPNDPDITAHYLSNSTAADGVVGGTRNSYTDGLVLGYQRDLGAQHRWVVKGEFQHRDLKRVLEDFDVLVPDSVCPNAPGDPPFVIPSSWDELAGMIGSASDYLLGTVALEECGYLIANPRALKLASGAEFPDGERTYKAIVLEATRKLDARWTLTLQYTWSKLDGNYEGLYRNDNDQDDPNLTSLWDFANEPLFHHSYSHGPLNTDRRHRFQAFGFHKWANGWSAGSRLTWQSGVPRLTLASHPVYQNQGEVLLTPRGSAGRESSQYRLDANVGKVWKLPTRFESSLDVRVDVLNVFNRQYGTLFENDIDLAPDLIYDDEASLVASVANGVPNPDFRSAYQYSSPREMRLGVRWKF